MSTAARGGTLMDWKTFFANVFGSLSWPSAIAFLGWLFRAQIRHLLVNIRKVGAGGVNLELAEEVERARDEGEKVEIEQEADSPETASLEPELLKLVQMVPEAAILQEFKDLEKLIIRIRSRLPDQKPHRTFNEVLKYLCNKRYISESVLTLFQRIRSARNAVVREREKVTSAEAIDLIQQIRLMHSILTRVQDLLPPQLNRI
jgi:hypothetical protein